MINKKPDDNQLLRYSGLAMQFLVSIGIGVFIGLKADQWLKLSIPLLVWLLPLLFICGMIYRIIKDTSKKK
ncbi:MAG: AtpZ/AtpI family protein [Ginsengibacter sp.]